MPIPQSAKQVATYYNERFDLRIDVWQTKTLWYFAIKVCPICFDRSRRKKEHPDYHCIDKDIIDAIRNNIHKYRGIMGKKELVELNKELELWQEKKN